MLTISRKPGESIFIGNNVVVTIQRAYHGHVSISIAAPRSVPILRDQHLSPERIAEIHANASAQ